MGINKSPELIKRILAGHMVEIGRVGFTGTSPNRMSLPLELNDEVNELIKSCNMAQWATANAIDGIAVRAVQDEDTFFMDADFFRYDIIVTLADKDYTYWKLTYD